MPLFKSTPKEKGTIEECRALIREETGSDPKYEADDFTLERFMLARGHNVEKAAHMFIKHQDWREKTLPNGMITEDEIRTELASRKVFCQGLDKLGRPVIISTVRNHNASARDFEEMQKLIFYTMDRSIECAHANGASSFLAIVDWKGAVYNNLDFQAARIIFTCFKNYYPERLGKLYFVDVPYVFWSIWPLIKEIMDKRTAEKIVFIESKALKDALADTVDLSILPVDYGGTYDGEMTSIEIGLKLAMEKAAKKNAPASAASH